MKFKLIGAMLAGVLASWGAVLDLAPTGYVQIVSPSNSNLDRGVYFNAISAFSIGQAGIWFDPLAGGATSISVSVYSASSLTQGGLLATAAASVSDIGMALYNVPINFTFTAGQQYYLAFDVTAPAGNWGVTNDLRFFIFNAGSGHPPFTVGGVVEVLDGALSGSMSNFVMPHVVLNTEAPTGGGTGGGAGGGAGAPAPEPGTYVLTGSAMIAAALRRRFRPASS
jgi:hypothetical protein